MNEASPAPAQPSKRRAINYVAAILFGVLLAFFVINIKRFSGLTPTIGPRLPLDFDVFYLAGQMVWRGEIEQAYSFATMGPAEQALSGEKVFMPWTYPPQFNLVVALLALMPLGAAFGLFTAATMIAYLGTLRRIAGSQFALVLTILSPVIAILLASGQNGFLTGTLIGLVYMGLKKDSPLAGLPLGLMVIKPHLAVPLAVYTLISRRWSTAAVAAATVLLSSALATLLLGPGIWTAFLAGVEEAKGYLADARYPLFRMVSIYAALRTLGLPANVAMAAQVLTALFALALVWLTYRRSPSSRQTIGVTVIASLLISPYAYDYDLPIYGIGLALLLPDLVRLASRLERVSIYVLSFVMGAFGFAQTQVEFALIDNEITNKSMSLTLAGLLLVGLLSFIWRILRRDWEKRAAPEATPPTNKMGGQAPCGAN